MCSMAEISTLDDFILADLNNENFLWSIFDYSLCFFFVFFFFVFFFVLFWGGGLFYFKLLVIILEYTMEVVGVLVYTEYQQ